MDLHLHTNDTRLGEFSVCMRLSCSGSVIYSFEVDVTFGANETLWAQGWPWLPAEFTETFTAIDVKKFAGCAFSMPCVALCIAAYDFNPWAPWWNSASETP